MGKITRKEMSKLFSCDYDSIISPCYDHYERYGEMSPKCKFWSDETKTSTGKNDGFWLLWGIFKEYIKPNIMMALLRKAHSHSIVICRLIKNE